MTAGWRCATAYGTGRSPVRTSTHCCTARPCPATRRPRTPSPRPPESRCCYWESRATPGTGQLTPPADEPWSDEVAANAATLAEATGFLDVPPSLLMRAASAYTHLFGTVSMELFVHLHGAFDNDTVFFDHSINLLADLVGFHS